MQNRPPDTRPTGTLPMIPITKHLPVIVLAAALAPPPSLATRLTCTTPGAYTVPTTQTFSRTTSIAGTDRSWPMYPGLRITVPTQVMRRDLAVSDVVMTHISVTDPTGKTYATPRPIDDYFGPTWISSTSVPNGSTRLTWTYSYRIVPSDGSTLTSDRAFNVTTAAVWVDGNDKTNNNIAIATDPATYSATNETVYDAPNQHNFGDLIPGSAGIPLVLPAPRTGSLNAAILWNGPAGTSMTQKIGSGSAVNVKPGTTNPLDTAGNSLRLDLNASNTASPGAVTGNLTLTLTCP